MKTVKFRALVKNSIQKYGMIQEEALKPIVGKKVMVTIDVDDGTEITEAVPTPVQGPAQATAPATPEAK